MRWILMAVVLLSGCVASEEQDCRMRCVWCVYVEFECERLTKVEPTDNQEYDSQ